MINGGHFLVKCPPFSFAFSVVRHDKINAYHFFLHFSFTFSAFGYIEIYCCPVNFQTATIGIK